MRLRRSAPYILSVGLAALSACATGPSAATDNIAGADARLSKASLSSAASDTAPKDAGGKPLNKTYADRVAMLRAADMAAFISAARADLAIDSAEKRPAIASVVIADELAAGRPRAAAAILAGNYNVSEGVGAILSAVVMAAQGDKDRTKIALKLAEGSAPARLAEIAESSIYESWGDLPAAAKVLEEAESHYVFRQVAPGGPADIESFAASLAAPDALDFALRAANVRHLMGDKAEAQRLYGLALALAPDEIEARDGLARLARGEKPSRGQLTARQAAARVYGALADDLAKRDAIADVLGAAIAGAPPSQDKFSARASIFNQTALVLDPDDSRRQIGLAGEMVRINEIDTALRVAARVKDPLWTPSAKLAQAQAYLKDSKDALAVDAAKQALAAAPSDALTLAEAGFVLSQAGQDAPALQALTSAASQSAASEIKVAIILTRASVHFRFGRIPQAVADARLALASAPGRDDIRATLASYLVEGAGTYDEGLSIMRAMLAASPDDAERMNALGYTLLSRPNTLEEGYRLLAKANAAAPYDWAIVDSIGWAYYLYGDYDAALERLQTAAEGFGGQPNPEVLDHLGDVQWRMGKKDDAKAAWAKALNARPYASLRGRIQAKLDNGITVPAPKKRKPPSVDLTPSKPASPT